MSTALFRAKADRSAEPDVLYLSRRKRSTADSWSGSPPHPHWRAYDPPSTLGGHRGHIRNSNLVTFHILSTRPHLADPVHPQYLIFHYPTTCGTESRRELYDDRSVEETWVKLPGGALNMTSFESSRIPNGQFAEIFDPSQTRATASPRTAGRWIHPTTFRDSIGFLLVVPLQRPQRMRHRTAPRNFYIGPRIPRYTLAQRMAGRPDILGEARALGLIRKPMTPGRELPNGHIIFTRSGLAAAHSRRRRVLHLRPRSNISRRCLLL